MKIHAFGFDWDRGNREHCRKHGVSIAEIEALFREGRLAIRPDLAHSQTEERFFGIGKRRRGGRSFLPLPSANWPETASFGPSAPDTCTGTRSRAMKKKVPRLTTDEQAKQFVETADLSEYDLSEFKPVTFEFQSKAAQLNMRVPQPLLDAVKQRAKAQGIPYTRFIRQLMEQAVRRPDTPKPGRST